MLRLLIYHSNRYIIYSDASKQIELEVNTMELMIGDKLKKLRRNRDLTQEEVAAHIGISYQAISKWDRGDGYPDITIDRKSVV